MIRRRLCVIQRVRAHSYYAVYFQKCRAMVGKALSRQTSNTIIGHFTGRSANVLGVL